MNLKARLSLLSGGTTKLVILVIVAMVFYSTGFYWGKLETEEKFIKNEITKMENRLEKEELEKDYYKKRYEELLEKHNNESLSVKIDDIKKWNNNVKVVDENKLLEEVSVKNLNLLLSIYFKLSSFNDIYKDESVKNVIESYKEYYKLLYDLESKRSDEEKLKFLNENRDKLNKYAVYCIYRFNSNMYEMFFKFNSFQDSARNIDNLKMLLLSFWILKDGKT